MSEPKYFISDEGEIARHQPNSEDYDGLDNIQIVNELNALEAQVAELQNSTYCAYCGKKFTLDDDAATMVSAHIKSCQKHPMRRVETHYDGIIENLHRDISDMHTRLKGVYDKMVVGVGCGELLEDGKYIDGLYHAIEIFKTSFPEVLK